MVGTLNLKVNDIVRIVGGQCFIITKLVPSRPANPYVGILVNGQGKEYKFGYKHAPTKIGEANANHPALAALRQKTTTALRHQGSNFTNPATQANIDELCSAVLASDLAHNPRIRALATTLHSTGGL